VPTTSHRAAGRPRSRGRRQRTPLTAAAEPVLEVVGVTAHAPNGRTLLDDVTFSVQRGWLVAVVGPTGAGKTSLARALTGGLALDAGLLRLDGTDLAVCGGRDRIGFVPQDDVLHGSLGLGQTLRYAASLRVPSSVGEDERNRRVDAALAELGLQHHAEVPVASLSGGQRKRANIAAELVGQPEVLVLDEPTSGLDPGYERSVMTTLRQLADAGRTVIAVTHSMQSLQQCDRVLYLAEGGRVAYFGPPSRAAAYFGQDDDAEVFLALDTQPGQAWKERFRRHPAYARYVTPMLQSAARAAEARAAATGQRATRSADPDDLDAEPDELFGAGGRSTPRWGSQVGTLARRQVALLRSDRRHLALLCLQGPVLGLLLRLVLRPDVLAVLPGTAALSPAGETVALFVTLSATWLGASNTVREVVKERHIVRREVAAGMAPSAYVAAKGLVLGVLTMFQSAVLALVACSAQHPPAEGALLPGRLELALVAALAGLAAASLGLLLSSLVTSPDKALAVLPVTLVAELVLAGRWAASLTAPGLAALRDLTGAHWGVDGMGASVAADASALTRSLAILGALALGSLVGAGLLVRRHTRPADAAHKLRELAAVADRRGPAIVGTSALGTLVLAVGTVAAGLVGTPVSPNGVVAATAPSEVAAAPAPAEQPVATTPAPATTVPSVAAETIRAVAPTTTATTSPPTTEPTTATTEPTTSTTYVTPTTEAPRPSGGVKAASSAGPQWWSPWYWFSLMTGQG
jgi:ABC-type multidrug transport system ATPase subunit